MNLKYLRDNDLMYIYFESNVPNTQTRTGHEQIFKFVAKAEKNKVIGYEVESASKSLNFVLTKLGLNSKQKLGICLYFIRERAGKTQEQIAHTLDISLSKYKSLEKADHNINFDTLESIFEAFPNESILETVFQKAG
ncbi:MAG: helix-turn-helix domain-containing protein [Bdellovibrionales bacterium]|nr:helix-turn-helix domain-containing protein [Bdellovibrionales bacterium]